MLCTTHNLLWLLWGSRHDLVPVMWQAPVGLGKTLQRVVEFLAAVACVLFLSIPEVAADGFDDALQASEAEASGDLGKALFLYGKAIDSGDLDTISLANTHFNRGTLLAKFDNLVGAGKDFSRTIQVRPDFALGHRSLAVVHALSGRDIKALASFGRALHLNPEDPVALNDRGTIYYKLGQLDEAIRDFTAALRIEPAYASAYYNRAATWEELDVPERAADDYRALLIIDPSDETARLDLARLGFFGVSVGLTSGVMPSGVS